MRQTLSLLAAVVMALVSPACAVEDKPADVLSASQSEQVERLVYKVLMSRPELVVEAIQKFHLQQQELAHNKVIQAANLQKNVLFHHANDPFYGNAQGKVVLVAFMDYQCGYCRKMHVALDSLMRRHAELKIVVKLLPFLGERSMRTAQLALTALQQGKFNQVHTALVAAARVDDELIKQQSQVVRANKAGEELAFLQLQANQELAHSLSVESTPSFFVLRSDGSIDSTRGFLTVKQLEGFIQPAKKASL